MTPLHVEPGSVSWDVQQRDYWSHLAATYDNLYESPWSQAENEWVASKLDFLKGAQSPQILDLGCGTGLGAELVSRWTNLSGYTGVDISPTMATLTAHRYNVTTRVSSMDDLTWVPSRTIDVVIALFSSASFAASVPSLLGEIARVLSPGGRVYLSALGRDRSTRPRDTTFRTRGRRHRRDSVPAHRFRTTHLADAAQRVGLVDVEVSGMNSLAGLLEVHHLWNLGVALAKRWPDTSHLLELTCSAPLTARFPEET